MITSGLGKTRINEKTPSETVRVVVVTVAMMVVVV